MKHSLTLTIVALAAMLLGLPGPTAEAKAPPTLVCQGYIVLSGDYRSAACVGSRVAAPSKLTCPTGQFASPDRTPGALPSVSCKPGAATTSTKQWNAYEAGRLPFGMREAAAGKAFFEAIFDNPRTPHCEYEDGSELRRGGSCKWDAGEDGTNETGVSFVVARGASTARFIYRDGAVE